LSIDDLGERFELSAHVRSPADPERICAYMHTALEQLVESLEQAPTTPTRSLEVLPASERHQLLVEWNGAEIEYPQERCIHDLFEAQARKTPEAVALVYEDRSLTYGALNARANRLAHHLRTLGVGPEARVAIRLERSLELVVAMLATLKAGGAYVPLDQNAPAPRQAFMLEDCRAEIALTSKDPEAAAGAEVTYLNLDTLPLAEESPYNLEIPQDSRTAAYVIYTSGSTGQPKGVIISHRNIGRLVLNNWYASFEADDRVAFTSNPAFDASTMEVWAPLLHGGCLVVVPEAALFDSNALVELLRQEEVSILHLVAGLLSAYADSLASIFPRLRYLLTGGDAADVRAMARILNGSRPQRLIHCYGPSESTTFATTHEVKEISPAAKSVPIGRPIANTQIYLLSNYERPAPIGVAGEIYIGGAGTAHGYLNHADLTAERFLPDPFGLGPGGRLYNTGDLGRWLPDGVIEFLGRKDFQVKIRGFRVELGEIEAQLASHPGVREVVALAREDEDGGKRLVAYYTGEEVGAKSLRAHLSSTLPEYMVPSAYIHLESLPLTPNGKLDRRALPAPYVGGTEERDAYLAPRTPVEEIVVGIFEKVLKLDRVGRRGNFFELGGHSLLATQVISRIRKTFGVEIGVRSVFENPTAEGLSGRIEEAMKAGETAPAPPLVRIEREGAIGRRFPLSFAQQRLWFIDRLNPGSAVYNLPCAARLNGACNLDALERVINEMVRRHEILRTRFEVDEVEPAQVIDEWEPRRLEVVDLTSLNPEEREEELSRRVREEAETGFDLSRGPLLRVKVLKLAEDDLVVFYTMSHIVSDAWSMDILIREVGTLYRAYSMGGAGEPSPLPELPIQYADFAVWQRAWLKGEVLEEKIEYWRRQLAGIEDLELPTDRPRPATRTFRGGIRHFVVDGELTRRLRVLSQREGVTLFMTMLGVLDILMSRYSGQQDLVIGTDIANRNRAEIEGLIGFFVNQLALRVEVRTGQNF
jgi:amino acid adenylation domain-containing protein